MRLEDAMAASMDTKLNYYTFQWVNSPGYDLSEFPLAKDVVSKT